jgi:Flp pilus assembly secretin CpaC
MTINPILTKATLVAVLAALPSAMTAQVPAPAAAAAPQSAQRPAFERVGLTAGRSTVVPTDFDITRIAITDPSVADAVVVQPREILVDGKKQGTVSLIVWSASGRKPSSTTSSSNPRSRRSNSICSRCSRARTSPSASARRQSSSPDWSRARM